jgi:ADP-ribose pyrophosphatase YjhB (NUDIX family)
MNVTQHAAQDAAPNGVMTTEGAASEGPPLSVVVGGGDDDAIGRMKAPPKCDNPMLRKDAKTTDELSQFVFSRAVVIPEELQQEVFICPPTPIPASSSSSAASTTESHTLGVGEVQQAEKRKALNRKMLMRTESRQGRESQRWSTEADTNQRVRLVTGCVPILKGGKILFVSASRKLEWILPKGGWERDESMEESAVRETFEEAGVLGTLGPQLTPIQYETRKSKKRRKDMADLLKKTKDYQADESDSSTKEQSTNTIAIPSADGSPPPRAPISAGLKLSATPGTILSDAVVNRIRESKPTNRSDETSSNASDSSTYSLVRMTLFPLYVSEVKDNWPESGRFRKIMDIDDAIEMLASREEFRSALLEVKERMLHLVSETPATIVQKDPHD